MTISLTDLLRNNRHVRLAAGTLAVTLCALPMLAQPRNDVGPSQPAVFTPKHTDDAILNAMQAELEREQQLLVLPGMQRPYFIQYRLEDFHTYDAVANYGALTSESENHQRVVRVEVRIGDYASDSSSARGDGSLALAPEDDNTTALRLLCGPRPTRRTRTRCVPMP